MSQNLVTVQSFSNDIDAEIIRGKLSSAGIKAFIVKDDCGGTDPMMQLVFGVKLKVDKKDERKALRVIKITRTAKQQSKVVAKNKTASIVSFIILMIYSIGTGLLLSGYVYFKSLIPYGCLFLIIGLALFLVKMLCVKAEHGRTGSPLTLVE